MTAATRLTVADIEAAYAHESHGTDDDYCGGWLGYGYLGERQMLTGFGPVDDGTDHERRAANVPAADAAVLAYANEHGWDSHRLFDWLNSRDGRHFADQAFDGPDGIARAIGWRLLPGVLGAEFRG